MQETLLFGLCPSLYSIPSVVLCRITNTHEHTTRYSFYAPFFGCQGCQLLFPPPLEAPLPVPAWKERCTRSNDLCCMRLYNNIIILKESKGADAIYLSSSLALSTQALLCSAFLHLSLLRLHSHQTPGLLMKRNCLQHKHCINKHTCLPLTAFSAHFFLHSSS